MMKGKIIVGVFITTLILLMVPTISAQQYHQVKQAVKLDIENQFEQKISLLKKINEPADEININMDQLIDLTDNLKEEFSVINFDTEPLFIKFLLSTLISLFFAILGTIFGNVFGPFLALLVKLITAPAVLLSKIISFLLEEQFVITA
jgi:hypothetical protein